MRISPSPLPHTGGYPALDLFQHSTVEEAQEKHHRVGEMLLLSLELNLHVEMPCIEKEVISGFLFTVSFPLFIHM